MSKRIVKLEAENTIKDIFQTHHGKKHPTKGTYVHDPSTGVSAIFDGGWHLYGPKKRDKEIV